MRERPLPWVQMNVVGVLQITHEVPDCTAACRPIMVRARKTEAIGCPIPSVCARRVGHDVQNVQIAASDGALGGGPQYLAVAG